MKKTDYAKRLRLLLEITNKISHSLDEREILNLVMDAVGELVPYDAAGIFLVRRSPQQDGGEAAVGVNVFRAISVRGYNTEAVREIRLKVDEGLAGYVVQKGEPVLCADVSCDPRYFNARASTRSEMVAPLVFENEVIGVFDLESDQPSAYTEEDLHLLLLLAAQVAVVVAKAILHDDLMRKRRLETQLEDARAVQRSLFPSGDPRLAGFDISARNFPSEEVSGDYYDFVQLYEDQLGLVIADVSGKGIPASLLMAFLRASLRAAAYIGYAPHVSLTKVNQLLWESSERNQFVTAVYGILDSTVSAFAYANAGHNPPLLMEASGDTRFVEHGELPLGMFKDTRYHQYHLTLEPGQNLLLYTDGLTEATNPSGEEYGRERLERVLRDARGRSARESIQIIYEDALRWTVGRGAGDDITLVIIKALSGEFTGQALA